MRLEPETVIRNKEPTLFVLPELICDRKKNDLMTWIGYDWMALGNFGHLQLENSPLEAPESGQLSLSSSQAVQERVRS